MSQPNGQDTSQQQQTPLPPGEYRKKVISACTEMAPILYHELQDMASKKVPALEVNAMEGALIVVTNLLGAAQYMESQAMSLTIAQNPGLVDPDGNPLSSRAKRRLEKEAAEIIPSFDVENAPEA